MNQNYWKSLGASLPISPRILHELLLGGQAFRWFFHAHHDCWTGIVGDQIYCYHLTKEEKLFGFSPSGAGPDEMATYLNLELAVAALRTLPLKSDLYLKQLADDWGSLSILRQPPEDCLLGFLLSSNKQILQIRAMLSKLAHRFGKSIIPDQPDWKALPKFEDLANLSEAELRSCGLGYRAKYVSETAKLLSNSRGFLSEITRKQTEDLKKELLELPGVGPKVADCVLLFAYNRLEAFPVDTWIEKIMQETYLLGDFSRGQIARLAQIHYGKYAGLVQQWLFASARDHRINSLIESASRPLPSFLRDTL